MLVPVEDCYKDKAPRGGGGAWLAFPAGLNEPFLPGHILALASACLSEQSEEDINVAALGKQQPENIPNPLYESTPSAPPEPSCDPFMVSLLLYLEPESVVGK